MLRSRFVLAASRETGKRRENQAEWWTPLDLTRGYDVEGLRKMSRLEKAPRSGR